MSLVSGQVLGEYELLEPIGAGGFAEVWRARHQVLEKTVAIKIPRDAEQLRRFQAEAEALHRIDHPGVVKVHAASLSHEPPYLVMDYVAGGSLRERIGSDWPLEERLKVLREILEALSAAHEAGYVHGDLKPENVLIDDRQGPPRARLSDFGLCRALTPELRISGSFEASGQIVGTLDYLPREVRDGQRPDERADVFAFGVMLFEVLTQRRPDVDDLPSQVDPELARFDEIFKSCYSSYIRRLPDARSLLEAWRELVDATPHAAPASEDRDSASNSWLFLFLGFLSLPVLVRVTGVRGAAILAALYFLILAQHFWRQGQAES